VAPVYYGFSRTRLVYLPEGRWRDFWTGALERGGQVVRRLADVEEIPVFARAGAIIPRLDPSPGTLLPAAREGVRSAGDDLRIDLYPGVDGCFWLRDGTLFAWDEAAGTLTISESPVARQVSVRQVGVESVWFVEATCGGQAVTAVRGSLNGEKDYRRVTVAQGQAVALKWRGGSG
jgi:alpha-glucosidase (family GH31 glycosyl hydrolase)